MTSILSIQSSVAYGHAGNSAATFPLMRMGVQVWPVLTVHFSNHTGYGAWRGPLLAAADVADVIVGLDERGVLARCDAVLSGYQGGTDIAEVVLSAADLVRRRNPAAVYCCDPVMGDVGRGFFVQPGIPEVMRDAVVPQADIVTPNQFELEFLTGRRARTQAEVVSAAEALRRAGPSTVLVTSVLHETTPVDSVSMLAVGEQGAWSVSTPLLPPTFVGAGDVTAALFLAHLLRTGDLAAALGATASSVFGLLEVTTRSGEPELALVAGQEEFVRPSRTFRPVRLT